MWSFREELYVRRICRNRIQHNIRNSRSVSVIILDELRGRPRVARVVENNIVHLNIFQDIADKVLRHICRQGRVHLRCAQPTHTVFMG